MHLESPWPEILHSAQAKQFALARIAILLKQFPGYAKIRRVTLLDESWSTENGFLTPTLKLKRREVLSRYQQEYQAMYHGYVD
jgi:long-chain acyl-CoA synthetase